MTGDEARSAHLLFAAELARGDVTIDEVLGAPEVRDAVRAERIPSSLSRTYQRVQVRRGRVTSRDWGLAPLERARDAVLGDRARGMPRVLLRVDEFPHYQAWDAPEEYGTPGFERFHDILADAGVPYLVAVTPRVPRNPMDPDQRAWRPHDEREREVLERLAADPAMAFGVHGLDHRTRHAHPRRHSELSGLSPKELAARLDAADDVLTALGLPTDVFVAPYNRFDASQFEVLAARYAVVTGGPESVRTVGLHRTPLWRGGAVYLPAYAPLYGRAGEVLRAVEELAEAQVATWIPVVLHWGWEQDDGWGDLERLAERLVGLARPWSELLDAATAADAVVGARARGAGA